jgi:hypothetical protein
MSPSRSPRIVPLGLFAILFQAILFGWHHHESHLAGHLAASVVQGADGFPQIADDEASCEICQVLHQLTAAPVNLAVFPPTFAISAAHAARDSAFVVRSLALGFHARAPPLA